MRLSLALAAFAILACNQSNQVAAASDLSFCKCKCFSNYTIIPLYRPTDPSKPCLTCTKCATSRIGAQLTFDRQFCLDQQLPICVDASKGESNPDTGTGNEGDVQAKCFQRDSLLAKASVISFLLLVTGLLVAGAFKDRITEGLHGRGPLSAVWQMLPSRTRAQTRAATGVYAPMR